MISLETKKKCVEMFDRGMTYREIYDSYFKEINPQMSLNTFKRKAQIWRKSLADDNTLRCGTYEGFTAHNATVQVNANGEVVQAWIKQKEDEENLDRLIDAIKDNTVPIIVENKKVGNGGDCMLEIPLFDQHFPLSDHKKTLNELLVIINSKEWDEINIIVGQDLIHNDDFRGRTTKGTQIEKVDIVNAWKMARDFYASVISHSLEKCNKVNLIYSKGNHDETMSWCFVEMLKVMFPQLNVDDSLSPRKIVYWKRCFIGVTHGNYTNSKNTDLRGQFTISFPKEFADADVREIHAGHLHHEREADLYGVMVRRLSSAVPTDDWSSEEGFVGSNKRFMVFEWNPSKLKAIYYI